MSIYSSGKIDFAIFQIHPLLKWNKSFRNNSKTLSYCKSHWTCSLLLINDVVIQYIYNIGTIVVVIVSRLDSQLPMQSVPDITTDVVNSNSPQVRCTRCNNMRYSLLVSCGRSFAFSGYSTNATDHHDITEILL